MVGHETLNLGIGVRLPTGQQDWTPSDRKL